MAVINTARTNIIGIRVSDVKRYIIVRLIRKAEAIAARVISASGSIRFFFNTLIPPYSNIIDRR